MLVLLADTHRDTGTGLTGRAATAVKTADMVVHAGDFTTTTVLDAFQAEPPTMYGVAGNRDDAAVADRIPRQRTVTGVGLTIAVTHGHQSSEMGVTMFGRSTAADLVVTGHTHHPMVRELDAFMHVNPGSHTNPRGGPPTHAELEQTDDAVEGRIVARDGTVHEQFRVERG